MERHPASIRFPEGLVLPAHRGVGPSVGRTLLPAVIFLLASPLAKADSKYYGHFLFDNSITPDVYFYSFARASAPSALQLDNEKLPVDTKTFYTPPNALRLEWKSMPNGGWAAELKVVKFRNRYVDFDGDTFYFWCFSREGMLAASLPFIQMEDTDGNFSVPLKLGEFVPGVLPEKWTQEKIPLAAFASGSLHPFKPHRIRSVHFGQGAADATAHTLVIDDVKIDDAATAAPASASFPAASNGPTSLPVPQDVRAKGYDRHIDITWEPVASGDLQRYVIYRSFDDRRFQPIGVQEPGITRYCDFLGKPDQKAYYKITACDRNYRQSGFSPEATASTRSLADADLLTMLQKACFRYYWEGAHPVCGAIRENIPAMTGSWSRGPPDSASWHSSLVSTGVSSHANKAPNG